MEELEQLIEKRQTRSSRKFPLDALYEKTRRVRGLLLYVERCTLKNRVKIKSEARRQYVISLVTAFEVFVGDTVVNIIDSGNIKLNKRIIESVKRKYDILEIENILRNNITIGELVGEQINFQNIEKTFAFLTELFSTNFYDLLYKNKFVFINKDDVEIKLGIRKNSHEKLAKIIKKRHQFVHDMTFNNTPSFGEILEYEILIRKIAACIDVKADQYRPGRQNSKIIKK